MNDKTSPLGRWARGIQVVVLMVVLFAPIVWMFMAGFKNRVDITRYPPVLFFTPTLDNYRELFVRTDFLENTLNSFIARLIEKGEYDRAFLLWQESWSEEDLLTFSWPADPRFNVEKAAAAFGWRTDARTASRAADGEVSRLEQERDRWP